MTELAAIDELVAYVEACLRDAEEVTHEAVGAKHVASVQLSREDARVCRQQLALLGRLRDLAEAEASADQTQAEQEAA